MNKYFKLHCINNNNNFLSDLIITNERIKKPKRNYSKTNRYQY